VGATVFYSGSDEYASLTNTFSVNNVPSDPTTVTLTVTDPTNASTTYTYNPGTITRVSAGVYTLDVACLTDGIWSYKWDGSGTASDIQEGTWTVGPSVLSQLYCTVEEVKSRLGITDTADDFELRLAVWSASRSIDAYTGRYFWRGTDTRTYVPESITRQPVDDLVSVTSLKVDRDGDGTYEETWTLGTDYVLEVAAGKYNTAAKGEQWPYTQAVVVTGGKLFPYTWMWSHLDRIQVAGVFGWPAVPFNVKSAALLLAPDLFRRKDAPFGIAGVNEFGVLRIQQDPMMKDLLARYKNPARVGV
jgi:hypothetical protein